MSYLRRGDLVHIVVNPYPYIDIDHENVYRIARVSEDGEQAPLYDVTVPNNYGEDTFPFWRYELDLYDVTSE